MKQEKKLIETRNNKRKGVVRKLRDRIRARKGFPQQSGGDGGGGLAYSGGR